MPKLNLPNIVGSNTIRPSSTYNIISGNLQSNSLPSLQNIPESLTRTVSSIYDIQTQNYDELKEYFEESKKNISKEQEIFRQDFQSETFNWNSYNQDTVKLLDRNSKYPVLAYSLAGNIAKRSLERLCYKLQDDNIIKHYTNARKLLEIAVIFCPLENFQIIVQHGNPDESQLQNGLFYAAYYGKVDVFHYIMEKINEMRRQKGRGKSDIILTRLRDAQKNTLLHVAVMGKQLDFLKQLDIQQYAREVNELQLTPLETALFLKASHSDIFDTSHTAFFDKVLETHCNHQCAWNVVNLISVILQHDKAGDYEVMLRHLLISHLGESDFEQISDELINVAIDNGNTYGLRLLIQETPITKTLDGFIEHARRTSQKVVSRTEEEKSHFREGIDILSEENVFRIWISKIEKGFRLYLSAYNFRSKDSKELRQLAQEDGVTKYDAPWILSATERQDRQKICDSLVENFFYFNEDSTLRGFFEKISSHYKKNPERALQYIRTNRSALFNIIKNGGNSENFNQQLESAFELALPNLNNENHSSLSSTPSKKTSPLSPISNAETPKNEALNEKETSFRKKFSAQFDHAYNFYTFISTGELIKPADGIDRLADIAKTAAGILPDLSVPLGIFGVPVPVSISFPSSIIFSALIDVCLYVRTQNQQHHADQVRHLFDATTLQDKTDIIHNFAELIIIKYREQINILDLDAVTLFAQFAVARIIRYSVINNNLTNNNPSALGTFFRDALSTVFHTGPEPQRIRKATSQIVNEALSVQEHSVFSKNKMEETSLLLAEPYKDPFRNDPNKEWTAKGIFENTGIRTENGERFSGRNQEVERYGYRFGTREEAVEKRMTLCSPSRKAWFENSDSRSSQRFFPPSSSQNIVNGHANGKLSSASEQGRLPAINK